MIFTDGTNTIGELSLANNSHDYFVKLSLILNLSFISEVFSRYLPYSAVGQNHCIKITIMGLFFIYLDYILP